MPSLNKMKKEEKHFFAHLLFPDCHEETDVELRWKENRSCFFCYSCFAETFIAKKWTKNVMRVVDIFLASLKKAEKTEGQVLFSRL